MVESNSSNQTAEYKGLKVYKDLESESVLFDDSFPQTLVFDGACIEVGAKTKEIHFGSI